MNDPAVDHPGSHECLAASPPHPDARDGGLDDLIRTWHERLMLWARNGWLAKAARTALNLPDHHPELAAFAARIAAADFSELPAILSLDWEDMDGIACAYAPERQLILINRDWLESAVDEQVFAVLTEQLGHHLDGVFNPVDTPGDEGELFLECLRAGECSEETIAVFRSEEHRGVVHLDGETLEVEEAGVGAFCLDLRDLPHPSPSELPPT